IIEKSGDTDLLKKYKDFISRKSQLSEFYNKSTNELERLGIDLKKYETETNQIERDISLALSKLTNKSTIPANWKAIQSKLKPNEAAVEVIRFNFYSKSRSDSTLYAVLVLTAETKEYPNLVV